MPEEWIRVIYFIAGYLLSTVAMVIAMNRKY